jgi:ABC-2 type transport system permease protein
MKNHWKQVKAVSLWEFKRFFKWKQEIMTYGIMLLVFGGIYTWNELTADGSEEIKIAITQDFALPDHDRFKLETFEMNELESIELRLGEDLDALVYLDKKTDPSAPITLIKVAEKAKWQASFQAWMTQAYQGIKLQENGITGSQLSEILNPFRFNLSVYGEEDEDKGKQFVTLMMLVLLMVGLFTAFAYIFASITSEKQQRVTEQLLSTMTAQTWMDGKIFGITLLCIKSMITTGVAMVLFSSATAIINGKSIDIAAFNFGYIFVLALFSILGILMWNSLMAGFAATIDDPNHSSRTSMLLIPIVPIFFAYSMIDAPQSLIMQFLSLFPLTSFAAMPMRIAESTVPFWQIALSVGLLVIAIRWFRVIAARMFNMGIMMYGKEPSWKEMGQSLLKPKYS